MELLQILLSLLSNDKLSAFTPLLELLRQNSFDIGKTIKSLTPEMLAPLFKELVKSAKQSSEPFTVRSTDGLKPIDGIADKFIVSSLNEYFESV